MTRRRSTQQHIFNLDITGVLAGTSCGMNDMMAMTAMTAMTATVAHLTAFDPLACGCHCRLLVEQA